MKIKLSSYNVPQFRPHGIVEFDVVRIFEIALDQIAVFVIVFVAVAIHVVVAESTVHAIRILFILILVAVKVDKVSLLPR